MTFLFNKTYSYLKENNIEKIAVDFYKTREFSDETLLFLKSQNFIEISLLKNIFVIDTTKSNKDKFLKMITNKYSKFTKKFDPKKIKNFIDLNDYEKEIFKNQKGKEYYSGFCPFESYKNNNKAFINIIFEKNDPAAWVITEKHGVNSIYLNRIYVKRKYILKGLFVFLIYFSIKNLSENTTKLFFYVNNDNDRMLKIMEKFDNYIISKEQFIKYVKSI